MTELSTELNHEFNLLNSVALVVDHLQDSVDKVDETAELIESLLSVKLPGIENNELSVVYQNHDTGQYELVVNSGKWTDKTERSGGWVKHASILKIAQGSPKTDDYPRYGVVNNADTDGFAETVKLANFSSAFAVPMRLSKKKAIGAFIALRKADKEPYTSEAIRVLDVVSDRFARFLTILHERQTYDEIFNDLRNDLQQRLANKEIKHESEILASVVGGLTTYYRDNRCYLLLQNPLERDQYYLVTDVNNTVIRDFRLPELNTVLSHDVLLSIVGSEQNLKLIQGNKAATQFYHGAFHNTPVTELSAVDANACKSWLGATIYHPKGFVFGHIILHSTEANAYGKRDVRFLDAVVDFTGLLLTSFRTQKKEDFITKMDASEETDRQKLYQQAADYLKDMYGVTHLDIYTINNRNLIWGLEYPIVSSNTPSVLDSNWQNEISAWANTHHIMPEENAYESDKFHKVIKGKPHILVPMRVGKGQDARMVVGCFAVAASNPAPLSIRIMDEVSDSLARRLNSIANAERYDALAEFSRFVSQQRADKTLTLESLLEFAYTSIAKVMYSQNLYIALHNQKENTIAFPWIYKEGEPWLYKDNDPSKPVWGSSRLIDSAKRGRTEEIILEGKPILINTLQDSKAWYAPSNRAEFVGNPLASWVGVPIFQPKQDDEPISAGILGVIAVYHPTLEYVYSVRDKFFLQEVAAHISGLFRILSLNEVNRQLEYVSKREQQQLLAATQEEELVRASISDQLQKEISDTVFEVEQAIGFTLKDIEHYRKFSNSPDALEDVFIMQHEALETINKMKSVLGSLSTANKKEHVNISDTTRSILSELNASAYVIEEGKSRIDKVETISGLDDCFISIFSLWKNITDLVSKTGTQAKYKIAKEQGKVIKKIIFDDKIKKVEIEEAISIPRIISNKRLGATIEYDPENPNVIIWSFSIQELQVPILILGGTLAMKKTLQDTLLSLGERAQISDILVDDDFVKVVFVLDVNLIKSRPKAKLIATDKITIFNDESINSEFINKTKLTDKNHIKMLLDKVGYDG